MMGRDPLDSLATGYAAERARLMLRVPLMGAVRDDHGGDPDMLARVAVEALRTEPAVLLAFAAEVTASLAAADLAPHHGRTGDPTIADCSWCGRTTLVRRIAGVFGDTGYQACGGCVSTARVYQPPTGHTGPWPPGTPPPT